jgi:hypothetical protein
MVIWANRDINQKADAEELQELSNQQPKSSGELSPRQSSVWKRMRSLGYIEPGRGTNGKTE